MVPSRAAASRLPIDDCLPELLNALCAGSNVLLRAPTGAGKTTRVPAAIDAHDALAGAVVMLEPRRIAARAAARRMAEEAGERVGGRIGYSVRFDDKTSNHTTLRVVTSGIFLRQLQDDPFLDGVGVVVLDEFHERGVDTDLALAMTRRVQLETRSDLRIVVMSATLQTERLQQFLGEPAVIESQGRLFPVEVRALPASERLERNRVDTTIVSRYTRRAYDETTGDVLTFLPGVGEIKRCSRSLQTWAAQNDAQLFELYGDLPADQQDTVFRDTGQRKVVLATNIAETSITLPRVTAVVDTGLCRSLRYDPATGLDRLELGPISKSSARQRCGRAGRTRPGICWQLWTAHEERSRPDEQTPEIERVDLTAAALQLTTWGETRLERFDWFEAPSVAALVRAHALLVRLEAIEDRSDGLWISTSLGKALERLPLHPRLARLIIEGASEGATQEAATCAALLSERSPFKRMSGPQSQPRVSVQDSDLLDEMDAITSFERSGRRDFDIGRLSIAGARNILRVRDQITQMASAMRGAKSNGTGQDRADTIPRALLKAFPDRLAARRAGDENRAVMVGGRGVTLGRECGVRSARLLLCLDLDDGPTEARIRRASAVDVEWLPADRLDTQLEYAFNAVDQRVDATTTTRYEGLSISTRPAKPGRDPRSARVLFEAARKSSASALDLEQTDFASFTARVACLGQWMPELGLPDPDDALLDELLLELCAGRISFEELRKAPLLDAFKARLDWEQLRALDKHAPEKIEIPSGSHITLAYERERPPVLAARIQELFGWSDSPTVAEGRVRVLLHLLAPNMRPQQVTDDLRNFWNTTYTEVRKELRQRYPKHDWPEDPWTASPRRAARRRR